MNSQKPHYAGFWIRFFAHVVDFILLNGLELLLETVLAKVFDINPFFQQIIGIVFSIASYYWYFCIYQVKHGTTFGKKLFSIYVIDEKTGNWMTKRQSIIRMLGYIPSYLIIGCGFLMAAFHPQKKGLHDLLAGTVSVVRAKIRNSDSDPKAL